MIQINNLTQEQCDMLDHMWQLETEEEFFMWYDLLDEADQRMADGLQQLIIQEYMEEHLEQTQYKDAKRILNKFVLH